MKKVFLNKKFLLVYALIVVIFINIFQLPHIISTAPTDWRSIHTSNTSDVAEITLVNEKSTLAQTHNMHLVLGIEAPNSILYVSESSDAEFASKLFGLGKVADVKKRDINDSKLIKKMRFLPSPSYSDLMWTSPGHLKSRGEGIKWKIYLSENPGNKFIFTKSKDNKNWYILDKSILTTKEISEVCGDC